MFDFEKLDVYRCAIAHLDFVFRSIPKLPRGYAALVDQWRRAAMSVPLNIAESVGKISMPDRRNRYSIARGEAMECAAIIDVVRMIGVLSERDLDDARELLLRVVRMLSRMCEEEERRPA